jgi:glycine cleavage system H protein
MRFSKTHEWARRDGDIATIGITDYAVEQLNREIVFVELPPPGKAVRADEACGVVEAVKTAADLYAPLSGTVEEVNSAVVDDPALLAQDPQGTGWLMRIRLSSPQEWDNLLTSEQYQQLIDQGEGH